MRRLALFVMSVGLSSCGEPPRPAKAASTTGELHLDVHGVPTFRPGLWEVERTDSSVPGEVVRERQCVGLEANEEIARAMNGDNSNCKVDRTGGAHRVRMVSECTQGGSKITTDLSIEGGDTDYAMRLKMTVQTPDGQTNGGETIDRGRWLGACPAGMSPGDMIEAP